MNYSQAEELFSTARNKRAGKPIANNTRLFKDDEVFRIRLWETDIVKIYPDDIFELFSGGYRTYTTKERINKFIENGYVYQRNNTWYIGKDLFFEGVKLNVDGEILNPLTEEDVDQSIEKNKKLDKMLTKYCAGFRKMIEAGDLEYPSGGDCWLCALVTEDGETWGDSTNDVSHIFAHFEEQYYVPSLLYNAIKQYGANSEFLYHVIKEQKDGKRAQQLLRAYFRRMRQQLLDYM